MTKWWRRIRGAIGIGLAWGMAWFGAGMILLLIVGLDAADVPFPLFFGFLGFLAGACFSLLLGIVERHRRFEEMSMPRFAGWGAAGGLLLAILFVAVLALGGESVPIVVLGPLFAAAGAVCAAGSLALARRAEEPALLDAGPQAAELEGDGQMRELP